jgi:hypothetical protein
MQDSTNKLMHHLNIVSAPRQQQGQDAERDTPHTHTF